MGRKVEYEVATIDEHGDVIDVDHHDRKADAIKACDAIEFDDETRAAIVGRITWIVQNSHNADRTDDNPTIYMRGCQTALAAGSWTLDEE